MHCRFVAPSGKTSELQTEHATSTSFREQRLSYNWALLHIRSFKPSKPARNHPGTNAINDSLTRQFAPLKTD